MPTTELEYALSPEELKLLGEIDNAMRDLSQQKQGALQLIVRSQHLEGTWNLVGSKLVKQGEQPK